MRCLWYVALFCLMSSVASAQPSLRARTDCGLGREVAAVRLFRLTRFRNDQQLARAITRGLLTEIPARGPGYELGAIGVHSSNPHLYRHARRFTLYFLGRLGRDFSGAFRGHRFIVTSLVRSERYQRILMRGNPNAAAVRRTSHTTGATMDIAWSTLSEAERAWMRTYLRAEEGSGYIQATEERAQRVFHVMVFPHQALRLACR